MAVAIEELEVGKCYPSVFFRDVVHVITRIDDEKVYYHAIQIPFTPSSRSLVEFNRKISVFAEYSKPPVELNLVSYREKVENNRPFKKDCTCSSWYLLHKGGCNCGGI